MPKRFTRSLLFALLCASVAAFSGCTFPTDVNSPSLSTVDGFPGPPQSIAVADFDGSGTPDVLVGFNAIDVMGLSLVKQDNYGFWTRTSPSGLAVGSSLIAVTDVDANGTPDAITADPGTNVLNIMKNTGSGSFTSTSTALPGEAQILKLASATDTSGSRWVSVLYQWGATERFRLYQATGGGLTAVAEPAFHQYSFVGPTNTMILANVFGDSAPDVILGENDGTVRVYMGFAANPAAMLPNPIFLTTPNQSNKVMTLAVGDAVSPPSAGNWTRDGYLDLLVGYNNSGRISGFRGTGGAVSTTAQPLVDPEFDSTPVPISLSIDAATGNWATTFDRLFAVMRGTRAEIKTVFTPIICDPTRATSLVTSSDDKPLGAMLCGDSNKLMIVGDRKRLAVPAAASFGSVNLGATGTQTVQTSATDFRKDDPTHTYFGAIASDYPTILNDETHQFSASGGGGCPAINPTLPWGSAFNFGNCALSVSFSPTSPGTKTATLELRNDSYRTAGATMQRVALTGTAVGSVASLPATMAFGNVRATSSSSAQLTISNTGNAAMSIDSITVDAPAGDWSIPSRTCGSSLPAGTSCTATVRFAPGATGEQSATLRLSGSQYGGDKLVALSGEGVSGAITGAPTDLGSVNHGDSGSASVTLTNDDAAPRTISAIATLGSTDFSVTDASECVGASLAPGQTCSATVSVSPTARGARSGTLRITSNASTATTDISLTATGLQGELGAIDDPTDLGALRVGFFKEVTIPLLNTGDAPLTIGSIDVEAPVVVSFACSAPIAPAESCDLVLRFEPTAEGPVSIPLQLNSDGVVAATEVHLSGEALPNADPAPPAATPPAAEPPAGSPASDAVAKLVLSKKRVAWKRGGRGLTLKVTVTAAGAAVVDPRIAIDLPKPLTYRASANRKLTRKVRIALKSLAPGATKTVQIKLSSTRDARKLKKRLVVRLSGMGLSATKTRFVLK